MKCTKHTHALRPVFCERCTAFNCSVMTTSTAKFPRLYCCLIAHSLQFMQQPAGVQLQSDWKYFPLQSLSEILHRMHGALLLSVWRVSALRLHAPLLCPVWAAMKAIYWCALISKAI